MRYLGQQMVASHLWHRHLAFQRSSELADLGWPTPAHIVANLISHRLFGFWYRIRCYFHIELFIVALHPFRCQSAIGPILPRVFSGEGDAASFRNAICHNYSIYLPLYIVILLWMNGIDAIEQVFRSDYFFNVDLLSWSINLSKSTEFTLDI